MEGKRPQREYSVDSSCTMIKFILKDIVEEALIRQGTIGAVDIEAQKHLGSRGTGSNLD